ncbi:MAG TPA: hypothetical protein VHD56_15545 [Tepidisphaeraceae bacterium]|nr:hypothetical protein [Tepidisphaeraceae bacterium]
MTAQEQLTVKTLILHNAAAEATALPEYRLLNELGHPVTSSGSADQAMLRLREGHADLVIIDADRTSQREFVQRLSDLPADQQPRQVAIFSEAMDERLNDLVHGLQRSKVHVLLKPLHLHGLLNILRSIESKVA